MDYTPAERVILDRYAEKTHIAGGPKTGYMMRKQSIVYFSEGHPEINLEQGLESLVEKGLVMPSDDAERYYLSEQGAEALRKL